MTTHLSLQNLHVFFVYDIKWLEGVVTMFGTPQCTLMANTAFTSLTVHTHLFLMDDTLLLLRDWSKHFLWYLMKSIQYLHVYRDDDTLSLPTGNMIVSRQESRGGGEREILNKLLLMSKDSCTSNG